MCRMCKITLVTNDKEVLQEKFILKYHFNTYIS